MDALKSGLKSYAGSTGTSLAGSTASTTAYSAAPYGLAGRISGGGVNNLLQQTSASAGEEILKESGKQAAVKTGLGTLGTVMAGIGTAYGLTDMGMQIAANKDHRTAG